MGIRLNPTAKRSGKKVAEIKDAVTSVAASSPAVELHLVPTPSTTLNLRCSGSYKGAFKLGTIVNLIGDSHTGKSLIALGVLAECSLDPYFDDYQLVYNDTENANGFDIANLFGTKLASRLEIISTKCHEYFEVDVQKRLDAGKKIIYVVDSFDGMTTLAAEELRAKNIKLIDDGKDKKESFGDGKAKLFSQFGGKLQEKLKANQSLCIIVSQTRQNISPTAMFNPKIRSGGDALKFYSYHELWLAVVGTEKHSTHKSEVIRVETRMTVKKNKLIGRKGVANISILEGYGVDNIKSCIDFLLALKHWTGSANKIETKGFYPEKEVSRNKLISAVEQKNKEVQLAMECQKAYDKLMADIQPQRKKRY